MQRVHAHSTSSARDGGGDGTKLAAAARRDTWHEVVARGGPVFRSLTVPRSGDVVTLPKTLKTALSKKLAECRKRTLAECRERVLAEGKATTVDATSEPSSVEAHFLHAAECPVFEWLATSCAGETAGALLRKGGPPETTNLHEPSHFP